MDRSLPTIIEPAPWVDYEIGGYYLRPTTIMRYSLSGDQERAVKYADLSRVSGVLDILSKVPWKINPKILKIVEQIWLDGGG
jgi:DNA-directed RNA polymerase